MRYNMAFLYSFLSGYTDGFFLERFLTWMHFDMEYKLNPGNSRVCNVIISYVNSRQEKIELIELLFKANFLDIMPWENYMCEFKDVLIIWCSNIVILYEFLLWSALC